MFVQLSGIAAAWERRRPPPKRVKFRPEETANSKEQRSIAPISWRATAVRLFGLHRRSTHAQRHDRHARRCHRGRKPAVHDGQFFDLAALLQTFRQTAERPNIIGMLCTPLNSAAQAQIVATDLLSLI